MEANMNPSTLKAAGAVYPELCYLTSMAVRFPVSIYWMGPGGPGAAGTTYQVMRRDEKPGAGAAFWSHHLATEKQFHPTPEAACVAFVASYAEWVRLMDKA